MVLEKNGYDPLPTWKPPRAVKSDKYPYHLLIWRKPWERMSQSQNDPILAEFCPENCVSIHPETAKKLGLKNLGYAWIESPVGKIKVKVNFTEGIRPDCVAVDHGFGHWSQGLTIAKGMGANDGDLIPNMSIADQLKVGCPGMSALIEDVMVKISAA